MTGKHSPDTTTKEAAHDELEWEREQPQGLKLDTLIQKEGTLSQKEGTTVVRHKVRRKPLRAGTFHALPARAPVPSTRITVGHDNDRIQALGVGSWDICLEVLFPTASSSPFQSSLNLTPSSVMPSTDSGCPINAIHHHHHHVNKPRYLPSRRSNINSPSLDDKLEFTKFTASSFHQLAPLPPEENSTSRLSQPSRSHLPRPAAKLD
ncbi:hypothetical protein B0T20DRAFT_277435 [Sordaria brevicollis]|uniref:Uncharacterized protein n=1 Tax=Sordaria brevicollis TaxID=83679 RepID=A0AAE0PB49_SORBR|nr:hypothetical protein B0T20DRAFT_277435 [Sordaria brevicollis]